VFSLSNVELILSLKLILFKI